MRCCWPLAPADGFLAASGARRLRRELCACVLRRFLAVSKFECQKIGFRGLLWSSRGYRWARRSARYVDSRPFSLRFCVFASEAGIFWVTSMVSHSHRHLIDNSSTSHRQLIDNSSTTYRQLIGNSSTSHRHLIDISSTSHRHPIDISSTSHRHVIDIPSTSHRHLIDIPSTSHRPPIDIPSTFHQHLVDISSTNLYETKENRHR